MQKGLIVFIVCAGVVVSGCGGAATPNVNATNTAAVKTLVAYPTNTLFPTATVIPPTATTKPTETAIPTATSAPTNTPIPPTPMPTSTPDVRPTYTITEARYLAMVNDTSATFSQLATSGGGYLTAVGNGKDGSMDFAQLFVGIDDAIKALAVVKGTQPPPRFAQAHGVFAKFGEDTVTLAQQITALSISSSDGQVKAIRATVDKMSANAEAWKKAMDAAKNGMNPNAPEVNYSPAAPPPAIATQTYYAVNATATAINRTALSYALAEYKPIAVKELKAYADRHAGEKVKISGTVFNIIKGVDAVQLHPDGTYDAVVVAFRDTLKDIYEDSYITVYGEIAPEGFLCFTNAMGAEVCQPHIVSAFVVK